jgi:hypothetical protein
MEVTIEPEHLFSLEDCSNLSKLTLNMELSESYAVRDSILILSTLDPERSSRLGEIALEVRYAGVLFDQDGPLEVRVQRMDDEDEGDESDESDNGDNKVNWQELDDLLWKLAKASINMRGKRLTFIWVTLEWHNNEEIMSAIRKWLPKLLPRFSGLGLLHVHYKRGSRCRALDDGISRHDKPDCLPMS